MPDFPALKTGAVAQDGSVTTIRFGTRVLRFTDGAEQRFRDSRGARRRWMIWGWLWLYAPWPNR